ncbi:MAG: hypothetical protein ACRDD7_08400 [Peptostreptococcaceae bacterium]
MSKKLYQKRHYELNKESRTALRRIKNSGEVVKYTELCKEIGVEAYAGGQAGGRQIEQHLKHLRRYAQIKAVDGGYLVEKVYIAVRSLPRRKKRSLKYADAITCLDYNVTRSDNSLVKRSKNRLIKDAGFINDNFVVAAANMQETAELLGIEMKALHSIISYFGTRFKLNSKELLQRSKAIQTNIDGEKAIKKGLVLAYEGGHRMANNQEVARVQKIERLILDGLNCKTREGAFLKGKWNLFTGRVNTILTRQENILYTYQGYQMRVSKKAIKTTPNTYNQARTRLAEQVEASILGAVNKAMVKSGEVSEKFLADIQALINVLIKPTDFNLQAELMKKLEATA